MTNELEFNDFIPFSTGRKLPAFPVEHLPEKIRNYAKEVAESLQVPVDMTAVSALVVISLCVQGKYAICPKPDWKEPLNLYSAIVGRPSERKSAVLEKMTYPIRNYMKEENERRKSAITKYELEKEVLEKKVESIKQAIAKGNETYSIDDVMNAKKELSELQEVKPVRLFADDTSPEALTSLLNQCDGKMSIISSEGGIFDIAAGRYSERANRANIDVFLKAFSGDSIIVDRKGRESETILNPVLTILLFVQPDVIQDIMSNRTFSGRGFLARFLYCIPDSLIGKRKYETPPITEKSRRCYEDLIYKLLDFPDMFEARKIYLDPEAYKDSATYFDIIEERLNGDLKDIEAWAGKYYGQIMRIAGILHCIKYETDAYNNRINRQTIQEAIAIGEYFLKHAQAAFEMTGTMDDKTTRNAKRILKRLESIEEIGINRTKLNLLCNGKMSAIELTEALQVLENRGYIKIEKIKTKGRPTENIIMNPEWYQQES